ncbi:MAG: RdgB/HAM1 family non-canonical purine NTP pyrophosphatase [Armatimonadota bacterium]|nr:RdgB/HAM1 family non-canonical purine NTP pyrophosphatase [Armatimonadota bacterium]MDR7486846.1 RdgB/HAM1 family non-canonical purine NTP pyrophosphatase [Armatimonadota bacterium]MDR7532958.1 RdgB/HAM1 family non-canonical purine NTP pyrophosphatase [Armatimonadota bacterium]MDR7537542.1 RdgB/HAM1 family non-canonical purine NTP pyrophosphatase [Armatimonadota bacterium]
MGRPAPRTRRLVLATRNPGKVREFRALLRHLPLVLLTLDDFPALPRVDEPGQTFAENAAAKAVTVARLTGTLTLADDSGVEIDALGGAPGVHSATFLGPEATDDDRNAWVLAQLRDVPQQRRTARYRAVVAVATPEGCVRTFEGRWEGCIADAPRGRGGFGYDPIFLVPELGKTVAELPLAEKNRRSHRARALTAARAYLEALLARQEDGDGPGN